MNIVIAGSAAFAGLVIAAGAAAQGGQSYPAQNGHGGAPAQACVLSTDGVTYVFADGSAVCTPSAAQLAASQAAPAAVPAGAVKPKKRLNKRSRPCFNDCR